MIKLIPLLVFCIANWSGSHAFIYNDSHLLSGLRDPHLLNYHNQFLYNETIQFLRLLTESDTVASNCKSSLKRWLIGIERTELWALKFLQSTGKLL